MPTFLEAIGNTLDLPGSMIRDAVVGKNPLDQWKTPFSSSNRTRGHEILEKYGAGPGHDALGMVVEMGLDPFVSIPALRILNKGLGATDKLGKLWRGMRGTETAAKVATEAAPAAERARIGLASYAAPTEAAPAATAAKSAPSSAAPATVTDQWARHPAPGDLDNLLRAHYDKFPPTGGAPTPDEVNHWNGLLRKYYAPGSEVAEKNEAVKQSIDQIMQAAKSSPVNAAQPGAAAAKNTQLLQALNLPATAPAATAGAQVFDKLGIKQVHGLINSPDAPTAKAAIAYLNDKTGFTGRLHFWEKTTPEDVEKMAATYEARVAASSPSSSSVAGGPRKGMADLTPKRRPTKAEKRAAELMLEPQGPIKIPEGQAPAGPVKREWATSDKIPEGVDQLSVKRHLKKLLGKYTMLEKQNSINELAKLGVPTDAATIQSIADDLKVGKTITQRNREKAMEELNSLRPGTFKTKASPEVQQITDQLNEYKQLHASADTPEAKALYGAMVDKLEGRLAKAGTSMDFYSQSMRDLEAGRINSDEFMERINNLTREEQMLLGKNNPGQRIEGIDVSQVIPEEDVARLKALDVAKGQAHGLDITPEGLAQSVREGSWLPSEAEKIAKANSFSDIDQLSFGGDVGGKAAYNPQMYKTQGRTVNYGSSGDPEGAAFAGRSAMRGDIEARATAKRGLPGALREFMKERVRGTPLNKMGMNSLDPNLPSELMGIWTQQGMTPKVNPAIHGFEEMNAASRKLPVTELNDEMKQRMTELYKGYKYGVLRNPKSGKLYSNQEKAYEKMLSDLLQKAPDNLVNRSSVGELPAPPERGPSGMQKPMIEPGISGYSSSGQPIVAPGLGPAAGRGPSPNIRPGTASPERQTQMAADFSGIPRNGLSPETITATEAQKAMNEAVVARQGLPELTAEQKGRGLLEAMAKPRGSTEGRGGVVTAGSSLPYPRDRGNAQRIMEMAHQGVVTPEQAQKMREFDAAREAGRVRSGVQEVKESVAAGKPEAAQKPLDSGKPEASSAPKTTPKAEPKAEAKKSEPAKPAATTEDAIVKLKSDIEKMKDSEAYDKVSEVLAKRSNGALENTAKEHPELKKHIDKMLKERGGKQPWEIEAAKKPKAASKTETKKPEAAKAAPKAEAKPETKKSESKPPEPPKKPPEAPPAASGGGGEKKSTGLVEKKPEAEKPKEAPKEAPKKPGFGKRFLDWWKNKENQKMVGAGGALQLQTMGRESENDDGQKKLEEIIRQMNQR